MTRARVETTPRKPRKGRDRCTAHRHDGQPCGAPAVPGTLVCRRHGGSAPQVRLAAERRLLEDRLFAAYLAWQQIHNKDHVPGQLLGQAEFDAMVAITDAERALEQFEDDLVLIALMKMEITDPTSPEVRQELLQAARDRHAGRPWTSPLRR